MLRLGVALAAALFLHSAFGLAAPGLAGQAIGQAAGHEIAQCSGCGCRGGPGYRAPNGRCVGWKELLRVCGDPPETRCTPEIVSERLRTGTTETQPRPR